MNFFKVNGTAYDVVVTAIEENFNIPHSENAGRTIALGARMTLDPLGTFYGHKVTVRCKRGFEEIYDALYNLVSKPVYDGLHIEVAHNQTTIEYDAYVSQGTRALKKIDEKTGKVYWGELQLNIVPLEAQVVPE